MRIKSFLLVLMFALAPVMWAQEKPVQTPPRRERGAGRASPKDDGHA
jgi:hypothetical protein